MGEQDSRHKSSFLGGLKKLGPLVLVLSFFTVLGFFVNWYGDVRYREGRSDMQPSVNDMALERNKATSSAESANSSLNLLQTQYTILEKENREVRGVNRDLQNSVASLSAEIERYKTRVVEVNEDGAVEVFDNQFLITARNFHTDIDTLPYADPNYISAVFYYIGDDTKHLAKTPKGNYDDSDESYLEVGRSLKLQHGGKWYCVRLLFIDIEAKKATFSQNILNQKPPSRR